MAILDLGKIIFNKTIIGITCAHCGGDLKQLPKIPILVKLLNMMLFNNLKPKQYQCTTCQKKYTLIKT